MQKQGTKEQTCPMLNAQCSMLNAQGSMLNAQCIKLELFLVSDRDQKIN